MVTPDKTIGTPDRTMGTHNVSVGSCWWAADPLQTERHVVLDATIATQIISRSISPLGRSSGKPVSPFSDYQMQR